MESRRTTLFETKPRGIPITQEMVLAAYKKVRKNKGSAGVDGEDLEKFQSNLKNNLYKLWNRMTSGSYFPSSVLEVKIPKGKGKSRTLGIPTVRDRIAQQVVKSYIEPRLESEFSENSYGYRPMKNAHQALSSVRTNVRSYPWVLDMDIKSFFDEVKHELLEKALERHVPENWVKLYIKRWLEVSEKPNRKGLGAPQGGVISPLLANLYLHYALDKWMEKQYPAVPFVRYADDVIIHCRTEQEALEVKGRIEQRLNESGLRLNQEKTNVVHCTSYKSKKVKHYKHKFGFLGFSFQPVIKKGSNDGLFTVFDCDVSQSSMQNIKEGWKAQQWHRNPKINNIQEIANKLNPQIRGLMNYFGKVGYCGLRKLFGYLHFRLTRWVLKKYKRFKNSKKSAYSWIRTIKRYYPTMFYHWQFFKYLG